MIKLTIIAQRIRHKNMEINQMILVNRILEIINQKIKIRLAKSKNKALKSIRLKIKTQFLHKIYSNKIQTII